MKLPRMLLPIKDLLLNFSAIYKRRFHNFPLFFPQKESLTHPPQPSSNDIFVFLDRFCAKFHIFLQSIKKTSLITHHSPPSAHLICR